MGTRVLPIVICVVGAVSCTANPDPVLPVEELLRDGRGHATFIRGDLGRSVADVAPLFGLRPEHLGERAIVRDELGQMHVRLAETQHGLPVIGAETILHVDGDGAIVAATSSSHGEITVPPIPAVSADAARGTALGATDGAHLVAGDPALVYVISTRDHAIALAWEVEISGDRGDTPVRDRVYVDARAGDVVDRHALIRAAKYRAVHSANYTTTLPGVLRRSEGGAPVTDPAVNAAYDHTGRAYDCYASVFNRDSWDDAGAPIRSTVHYGVGYDGSFWSGSELVFGDGGGVSFAGALDVVVHELTHAVVESAANLPGSNEPGALGESMSDIFGAVCEAWQEPSGFYVDSDVWTIGEDVVYPPLRVISDPAADGVSCDYYPNRYLGPEDDGGVHINAGIGDLAFYLLVNGGTHPRGHTTIVVPALGIEPAARIFYRALTAYLTPTSGFAAARQKTLQAALDLYGPAERDAVAAAWDAVGVAAPAQLIDNPSMLPHLAGWTGSVRYYRMTVPAGAVGLRFSTSGGTGNADLYVRRGDLPSLGTSDGRSVGPGNDEALAPAAREGDWYVMIHGARDYAELQLVASYTPPSGR